MKIQFFIALVFMSLWFNDCDASWQWGSVEGCEFEVIRSLLGDIHVNGKVVKPRNCYLYPYEECSIIRAGRHHTRMRKKCKTVPKEICFDTWKMLKKLVRKGTNKFGDDEISGEED